MQKQPEMVMVCGANGAGKTTFTNAARERGEFKIPFLDPDAIAKKEQATPVEAGKLVANAIKGYLADKQSFIRESTLSAKFDLRMMQEAKENGFKTSLIYICNGSPDTAVARVAKRHADGGHTVPEEDIRRRFVRGLDNLPEAIRRADEATIYDNCGEKYRKVATFENGKLKTHDFTPAWFKKPLEALKANLPLARHPQKPPRR